MKKFIKHNSLSIVLLAISLICIIGHFYTGWHVYNDDQQEHGRALATQADYFFSGHFWESVSENWESEFLQMMMYVILTIFLIQTGSSESKDPAKKEKVDEDPKQHRNYPGAPWPVRAGGWVLSLYKYSLSLALGLCFLVSFIVHIFTGAAHYNQEQLEHGRKTLTAMEYFKSSQFWFESFQNWQSEFLSIAVLILLSIYLRQQGSPESKPVFYPHHKTGKE